MKTTKERLAVAIHTPLNETLSFYKTSLTGLTEEQVEKNRDLELTFLVIDTCFKEVCQDIVVI